MALTVYSVSRGVTPEGGPVGCGFGCLWWVMSVFPFAGGDGGPRGG